MQSNTWAKVRISQDHSDSNQHRLMKGHGESGKWYLVIVGTLLKVFYFSVAMNQRIIKKICIKINFCINLPCRECQGTKKHPPTNVKSTFCVTI